MTGGHAQHMYGPMDQSLPHNAKSVPSQDGVDNRLYLEEGTSSTPSARIMCPGLMVRVTIREAPAPILATGAYAPGRMQLAHVTSNTHDAGACIDGLRDEQAPHPSHMADRQLPCTRRGTRIDLWDECPT
jgi:hypothetical protein